MQQLTSGLLDILEGRTHHSKEVREKYLAACVKGGYDVSAVRDLPPHYRMLFNYVMAKVKQVAGTVMAEGVPDARLDVCQLNTCGLFRILDGHMRCASASCGCYLKIKVQDSEATCPEGLW